MKKKLPLLFILMSSFILNINAQALGETAVKEMLTKVFNQQLPKILGNGKLVDGLNLGTLKIRPGHIRLKGKTKWNLKLGKNNKPIKFKGNISTRFKNFGKSDIRVNFPGDRFLFFRKYQKLSDLVDLKKLGKGKK